MESASSKTSVFPEEETVSEVVYNTVADAEGVSPLELPPLATVIDTDALERFIASTDHRENGSMTSISFSYSGYDVTVTGNERVYVTKHNGKR